MPTTISLPVLATSPMRLTPTDVSQFVRLDQCERFLRFRLVERAGQDFMKEYDVNPQRITPLLSLSGHDFEEGVEAELGKHFNTKFSFPRHSLPRALFRCVSEVNVPEKTLPHFCPQQ